MEKLQCLRPVQRSGSLIPASPRLCGIEGALNRKGKGAAGSGVRRGWGAEFPQMHAVSNQHGKDL